MTHTVLQVLVLFRLFLNLHHIVKGWCDRERQCHSPIHSFIRSLARLFVCLFSVFFLEQSFYLSCLFLHEHNNTGQSKAHHQKCSRPSCSGKEANQRDMSAQKELLSPLFISVVFQCRYLLPPLLKSMQLNRIQKNGPTINCLVHWC